MSMKGSTRRWGQQSTPRGCQPGLVGVDRAFRWCNRALTPSIQAVCVLPPFAVITYLCALLTQRIAAEECSPSSRLSLAIPFICRLLARHVSTRAEVTNGSEV